MSSHALAQRSLAAMLDPARPAGPRPGVPAGTAGTLLAMVPIPGTENSLAIVGYEVPSRPDGHGAPSTRRPDGALVVDHARRRVWLEGAEIRLTYQEFELLAFLSAHPAQVFSRADLLARVWPDCPPASTRTVDVHVSRLRRKLGPVHGPSLGTEYRVGYRFEPPGPG
jgi:hypothetical protein